MVAMLKSLQSQGADVLMVRPMKKLMVNPTTAFFVLGGTMYIAATFFWPTPAVALVGTVLIPVAMKVGLPALAAAVSLNLFGHGMALSGDLVIQGATRLTSSAAGLESSQLLPYTALFAFIVGGVAISISFYTIRRDMKRGILTSDANATILDSDKKALTKDGNDHKEEIAATVEEQPVYGKHARFLSMLVPITLLLIVSLMIYRAFFDPDNAIRGGAATSEEARDPQVLGPTGRNSGRWRLGCQASTCQPSMRGIITSSSTTSGRSCWRRSMAWTPSRATWTS
jgi:hypothetical protein